MNSTIAKRQDVIARWLEEKASNENASEREFVRSVGIKRSTFRDWMKSHDAIMNERQGTCVSVSRRVDPDTQKVIDWVHLISTKDGRPPSTREAIEWIQSRVPSLIRKKCYKNMRSFVENLVDRAHLRTEGFVFRNENQYGCIPVPKKSRKTKCRCKRRCGRSCKNRIAHRECSDSTCHISDCGNRAIQNAGSIETLPLLERRHTPGRGDGMFAAEDISKHTFIREYVGKIVTTEEKDKLNENDRGAYLMELTDGLYIDAMPVGNESRLFNHSCKSNSYASLLYVNDAPRVGIFSRRPIQKGEEVTIDYGSDYDMKVCLCSFCAKQTDGI